MSTNGQLNKLSQIDSLRGVAILMVIVTHVCPRTIDVHSFIASLCVYGRMGVQLFFVMSALTLCLSMKARSNEGNALTKFYVRRFFRIAPVYYFGIALYTTISVYQNSLGNVDFSDIFFHLTLTHAFSMDSFLSVVPGGWSIGVECAFYLVFPLLYKYLVDSDGYFRLIIGYVVAIICGVISVQILALFFRIKEDPWEISYWNMFSQLPVFMAGLLLYKLYNISVMRGCSMLILWGGFLCCTIISLLSYKIKFPFHITLITVFSSLSFVFLYFIFERKRYLNPVFLQNIGRASYSMYIFHFVVMWGYFYLINKYNFNTPSPGINLIIHFSIVVWFTYLISSLSMKLLENNFILLGKRVINRMN